MISEFVVDVLTLRQGRRVDEVAANMHKLRGGARVVQDWYSFLREQAEVSLDRESLVEALLYQEEVVKRLSECLDEDNMRLAAQHRNYLFSVRENLAVACDDEDEDDPPLLSLAFAMDRACYTRQHAFHKDVCAVGQGMSAGRSLADFLTRSSRFRADGGGALRTC